MARNITPFGLRSLLDPGRGGEEEVGRGGEGRGKGRGGRVGERRGHGKGEICGLSPAIMVLAASDNISS